MKRGIDPNSPDLNEADAKRREINPQVNVNENQSKLSLFAQYCFSGFSRLFLFNSSAERNEIAAPNVIEVNLNDDLVSVQPSLEKTSPSLTNVILSEEIESAIDNYDFEAFARCLTLPALNETEILNTTSKEHNFIIHLIAHQAWTWLELLITHKRINIDAKDSSSGSLLHQAAKQGNVSLVKPLISLGANLNLIDDFNLTPLHLATKKGQLQVVQMLLRAGANAHALNDDKHNALHMALYDKDGHRKEKSLFYQQIAAALLNSGVSYSTLQQNGFKLMLDAASVQAINLLEAYIAQGLTLNVAGPQQTSVLHEVIKKRGAYPSQELNFVEKLILLGSNIHHKDITLSTPLHYANNALDANTLIKFKADINCKNDQKYTPLLAAVSRENKEVTQFLFQKTLKPYRGTQSQENIMHVAKKNNRHTSFSKDLKSVISFSKTYINQLESDLQQLFELSYQEALKANKKLIILIGETHGDYEQYQKEKVILKAAQNFATHLLLELKPQTILSNQLTNYMPLTYGKRHLKYTLVGADNNRDQGPEVSNTDVTEAGMFYRDVGMEECVTAINQHACMIVGASHLQGLVENTATKINPKKFFVVPLCLSKSSCDEKQRRATFKKDPTKVIFLGKDGVDVSQVNKVIQRWNNVNVKFEQKTSAAQRIVNRS